MKIKAWHEGDRGRNNKMSTILINIHVTTCVMPERGNTKATVQVDPGFESVFPGFDGTENGDPGEKSLCIPSLVLLLSS